MEVFINYSDKPFMNTFRTVGIGPYALDKFLLCSVAARHYIFEVLDSSFGNS